MGLWHNDKVTFPASPQQLIGVLRKEMAMAFPILEPKKETIASYILKEFEVHLLYLTFSFSF